MTRRTLLLAAALAFGISACVASPRRPDRRAEIIDEAAVSILDAHSARSRDVAARVLVYLDECDTSIPWSARAEDLAEIIDQATAPDEARIRRVVGRAHDRARTSERRRGADGRFLPAKR